MVASSLFVQTAADYGINYTTQAAAAGLADAVANDGRTLLLVVNTNAAARTLTVTKQNQAPSVQGYNPITLVDTVVTVPGSGTNGGLCVVGPFAQLEYNDPTGLVQLAWSAVAGVTVSAVSVPRV